MGRWKSWWSIGWRSRRGIDDRAVAELRSTVQAGSRKLASVPTTDSQAECRLSRARRTPTKVGGSLKAAPHRTVNAGYKTDGISDADH